MITPEKMTKLENNKVIELYAKLNTELTSQIIKFGDISQDIYEEYSNRMYKKYKDNIEQEKQFYLKCFKIYSLYTNPHEGFEKVKINMNYKFNRRTLLENMKKNVPIDEYNTIIKKQTLFMQKNFS